MQLQPLLQLVDLVDGRHRAGRDRLYLVVDLRACGFGDLAGGLGEYPVDMKTARVDRVREHPHRLLGVRQLRQSTIRLALDFDVDHAIGAEPLHLWLVFVPVGAFRILAKARLPRLRHQVHQALASGVLAIDQLQHIGEEAELGRQSERESRCLGAAMTLGRNNWKAVERMQLVFFDGAFESVVVRTHDPARICRSFELFRRNGIARAPQLHGTVVDGKRHP